MNTLLTPEQRMSIKERANAILKKHGDVADRKSLLLRIAQDNGIEVREADLFDISGTLRCENDHWRIYVNRQDSSTRQLFTLAHELGHYFLHKDSRSEFIDGGFVLHREEATKYEIEEVEANEFAANLTMPEEAIVRRIGDVRAVSAQNVTELAREFGVSLPAMAVRLHNIGYGVPDKPTSERRAA